eukprot:4860143-Prymnesium_polylepis.2
MPPRRGQLRVASRSPPLPRGAVRALAGSTAAHRVDGDAARRELARHRHGHADHARLGRGVVGLADVANLADDRRDVDDPARPLLEHELAGGLRREEDAVEVGVDDIVPLVRLHAN